MSAAAETPWTAEELTVLMQHVGVERYDPLVMVRPLTPTATEWLHAHTPEGAMWWGGALVTEDRHLHTLLAGLLTFLAVGDATETTP